MKFVEQLGTLPCGRRTIERLTQSADVIEPYPSIAAVTTVSATVPLCQFGR
jgi:hypothetical protein